MRVALLATGVMEYAALAGCLGRLFPNHVFEAVPRVEGRPGVPAIPFSQSFSNRVVLDEEHDVPTDLTKIVQELAAQVYPPREGAADVVVVVDDLELWNLDQPGVVMEAVRRAVARHVDEVNLRPHEKADLRRCLRERASFHLAAPMTEAWFYGDPGSTARNRVPEGRAPRLRAGVDPEAFETDDADYSADQGEACAQLLDRNRRRKEDRRPPWVIAPKPEAPWFTRERHPKAYLQWLCRDPRENACTAWQESKSGAEALRALDWQAVLANPAQCTFARALLADLADALREPAPFPAGGGLAPQTARRQGGVLRNV